MIQIDGIDDIIKRWREAGATSRQIAVTLTIATSRTIKEVRRRADRMIGGEFGLAVKKVKPSFPFQIRTKGGIKSESFFAVGWEKGVPFDTFPIRKIGGKKANLGYRAKPGRKSYDFPDGFLYEGRLIRREGSQLVRIRTESPLDYLNKVGGVPVLNEYAKQKLRYNINRQSFALLKYLNGDRQQT